MSMRDCRTIILKPDLLHPRDIFFRVKLMQLLHKEGIILQVKIFDPKSTLLLWPLN